MWVECTDCRREGVGVSMKRRERNKGLGAGQGSFTFAQLLSKFHQPLT